MSGREGEAWRALKVGERVRIVRMPSGIDAPGSVFASETRRLYKKLIERNRPVRVTLIDDWDIPWIEVRFRRRIGQLEQHILAINDDSWVKVRPRK